MKILAIGIVSCILISCGGGSSSPGSPASSAIEIPAPSANAGTDQNVVTGSIVTLDGSTSTVGLGRTLTYTWTLTQRPAGSATILTAPTSSKPTFTADLTGTYIASVVVNDGTVNSAADTVSITASVINSAPIANAGVVQNVVAGTVVTLDGSSSSDANSDPLTYAWTLSSKPTGSAAVLSAPASAKPVFTADIAGTYVASLLVNDGKVNSSNTSTVSITAAVLNVAPVANAGFARSVAPGATVTIDGSASTDANGDPLTFAWTLSVPSGSSAVLSSQTASKPTFIADVVGTYVASLLVNDGKVNSTPKTVAIAAIADLSQLFSKSSSSGGMQVGTYWQAGSTFSFSITNNSTDTFTLTKYELLNAGVVVTSTMDSTLLSGGELTPGENVGLTTTLARALDVSSTPGNGLRSIYYLTLTRTGQQFTVINDW